jgi:ABC-2 type transport system ATP-binding protein
MSAIETDGLGKRYGSTWALRECTLAIPEGSLAALVGPNGAGKTTLMQMLTGLVIRPQGPPPCSATSRPARRSRWTAGRR